MLKSFIQVQIHSKSDHYDLGCQSIHTKEFLFVECTQEFRVEGLVFGVSSFEAGLQVATHIHCGAHNILQWGCDAIHVCGSWRFGKWRLQARDVWLWWHHPEDFELGQLDGRLSCQLRRRGTLYDSHWLGPCQVRRRNQSWCCPIQADFVLRGMFCFRGTAFRLMRMCCPVKHSEPIFCSNFEHICWLFYTRIQELMESEGSDGTLSTPHMMKVAVRYPVTNN